MGSAENRYPWFHRALGAGEISLAHIEVLHPVWKHVNRDHLQAAERTLAQLATLCTPEEFADYLAEWRNCADEDEHLDEFHKALASQHLLRAAHPHPGIHGRPGAQPGKYRAHLEILHPESGREDRETIPAGEHNRTPGDRGFSTRY